MMPGNVVSDNGAFQEQLRHLARRVANLRENGDS